MILRQHSSVRVHQSRTLYSGQVFDLVRESIELPSGLRQELDLVAHGGAVAIAAQAADGRLLVVKQYRAAIGDWMLEIPAGRLEVDEEPLPAARRELEEETGYRASTWKLLRTIVPAPGFASERIHIYLAAGLLAVGEERLACDVDEELEVRWCTPQELLRQTSDAKSLIAALLLAANPIA